MANLAALPAQYRSLDDPASYPIERSERLTALRDRTLAGHVTFD